MPDSLRLRGQALVALELQAEVDQHEAVFCLDLTDKQDMPDHGEHAEIDVSRHQPQQASEAVRASGRQIVMD